MTNDIEKVDMSNLMERMRQIFSSAQSDPVMIPLDKTLLAELEQIATVEGKPLEVLFAEVVQTAVYQHHLSAHNLQRWHNLTSREKQIAALICHDYGNQQIAARLFISVNTVKTHVGNIYSKFDINGRKELRDMLEGWDFSPWLEAQNLPSGGQ